MKKLFSNFRWRVMVVYLVLYAVISVPCDWLLLDEFDNPGFSVPKYVLGLAFRSLFFSFVMSLIFGKKIMEQRKDPQ